LGEQAGLTGVRRQNIKPSQPITSMPVLDFYLSRLISIENKCQILLHH